MSEPPPSFELSSWKEIARHLQVSVRTAQLWEKQRGLPVRRVPGRRGRVYLRLDDLEHWLERQPEGERGSESEPAGVPGARRSSRGRIAAVIVLAVIVVAALVFGLPRLSGPPAAPTEPATIRIEEGHAVGVDAGGAEIWRFWLDDELETRRYDDHPQLVDLVDLDRDGSPEALVTISTSPRTEADVLVCLDARGNELWRFQPGDAVRTSTHEMENIYRIRTFGVAELASGERVLAIVAQHYINYPTQVTIVDSRGDKLREYWHAGHIGNDRSFLIDDLDGDGADELYVAGMNNARDQATLVVLDPASLAGAAAETSPVYRFEAMPPGREIARVFFPQSILSRTAGDRYNQVIRVARGLEVLHIDVRESINREDAPTVAYTFEPDLTLRQISLSDIYIGEFRLRRREGVVEHDLDDERRSMTEGVEIVRGAQNAGMDGR